MDKIITSAPVNKTAAVVTSKGYQYTPIKKIDASKEHWTNQPPMVPVANFQGNKCSRLAVVGKRGNNKKKGARYVVRCVCGNYEIRYASALRNKNNTNDCCEQCRHVDYLRKKQGGY